MFGADKELESYRKIMEPPGTFEEGFSWQALVGAMGLVAVIYNLRIASPAPAQADASAAGQPAAQS